MSFRLLVTLSLIAVSVGFPPIIRTREEIENFSHFLDECSKGIPLPQLTLAMEPGSQMNAEEWSGRYEGDILLDEEQKAALLQQFARRRTGERNAVFIPANLWPNAELVYEIKDRDFSPEQEEEVEAGIADLQEISCLKFRKRSSDDVNYVLITGQQGGCYATVGYSSTRGVHTNNLAAGVPGTGCLRRGTIIHELLHNLGFLHMQSTWDRDQFVRIAFENIIEGMEGNFELSSPEWVSNLGVEYDYGSCLHYSEMAFSDNGKPTIIPLKPYNETIGQRTGLSEKDIIKLNRLYNCPGYVTSR